jgi:hypothetical protein
MKHEDGKGLEMQTRQRPKQALIVTNEATKMSQPAETAFNNPAAREKDKALFRLRQLDDHQANAVLFRVLSRDFACITLVDKSDLNRVTCCFLNLLGQLSHLSTVLVIGGRHVQGQQMTEGINRPMGLAAFAPLSGLDCSVRLSKIAALGCSLRSSANRNSTRRSCTIASNTPAFSQRCIC